MVMTGKDEGGETLDEIQLEEMDETLEDSPVKKSDVGDEKKPEESSSYSDGGDDSSGGGGGGNNDGGVGVDGEGEDVDDDDVDDDDVGVDKGSGDVDVDNDDIGGDDVKKGRCLRVGEVLRSSAFILYIGHFLSSWGDRMWSFAVAVFLIGLDSDSLRLPAIYGFTIGATGLLFKALIGDWVDRTARMKTVVVALVVQNVSVAACAGVVILLWLLGSEERQKIAAGVTASTLEKGDVGGGDGSGRGFFWWQLLCQGVIIAIACVANLASTATKISIQKDWIVVVSDDADDLARMNSVIRSIDLLAKILAPIATGFVMTSASHVIGAAFIAGWNLVSLVVEYLILRKVYLDNPALKHKATKITVEEKSADSPVVDGGDETKRKTEANSFLSTATTNDDDQNTAATTSTKTTATMTKIPSNSLLSAVRTLYAAWSTYMRHSVRDAGLGLAFLYMTVLGFDSITIAFAYSQGLCASALGGLQACGAVMGILGTLSYPALRRHLGLERTGLCASTLQISCLALCLVSIFLPGSPFVLLRLDSSPAANRSGGNLTLLTTSITTSTNDFQMDNVTAYMESDSMTTSLILPEAVISGSEVFADVVENRCPDNPQGSYVSVGILMAGIILARFGLWNLDLTITQILQEQVAEAERGIVNGVQHSLQDLLDMIKFILVIFIPHPKDFAFLIILSFLFVTAGGGLYISYTTKIRGHFFHFEKLRYGCCGSGKGCQSHKGSGCHPTESADEEKVAKSQGESRC